MERPRAAGFPSRIGPSPPRLTYKQVVPGRIAQPIIGGRHYGGHAKNGKPIGKASAVMDFNSDLLRGYRGSPGIKIRINQRAFQYASTLARQILDSQISRIQIPDITQRIEEVFAEVTVCNIHISNYRPPQCFNIFPAPPNLIVINVEDLDIGVTGNLDGMANLIFPIQLSGIVHANFYHVSATITLRLDRSVYGAPQLVLCGCDIKIPFADVCIECGGLLGTLVNLFFRQEISGRVRSIAPERICGMLPQVINERINPLLARIPQSIPFTQMVNLLTELLGRRVPAHCLSPQCQARLTTTKSPPIVPAPPPKNPPPPPTLGQGVNGGIGSKNTLTKALASVLTQVIAQEVQPKLQENVGIKGKRIQVFETGGDRKIVSGTSVVQDINDKSENRLQLIVRNGLTTRSNAQLFGQSTEKAPSIRSHSYARKKRGVTGFEGLPSNMLNNIIDRSRIINPSVQQSQQTIMIHLPPRESYNWPTQQLWQQQQQQQQKTLQKLPLHSSSIPMHNSKAISASGQHTTKSSDQFNKSAVRGVPVAVPITKRYGSISGYYKSGSIQQPVGGIRGLQGRTSDPCAGCPPDGGSDSFGAIGNLIKEQLDLRKVANLVLTTQLLQSYATFHDYNIDLNGEFSPNGRGGTPFGPFPMQWPTPVGSTMIEILISDFTINSLLYWLHRTNFLSFRIGPETPSIGALLTTTCDISSDYSEEESENEALLLRLLRLSQRRRRYHLYHQQRSKRQAITGGDSGSNNLGSLGNLADLGICLGDILPAIKEKYPNRTLALSIHTARAPSIMISGRGGGSVQLDLSAFVDIYLDKTNIRVGTIIVTGVADITLRIMGNRIIGNASLPVLRLVDRDQTLGLQQDALDNLASLANDMILRAANQQLNRGMEVSLPTTRLPINIINPHFRILEHAIYIGSDFTISPSALQMLP